MLITKFQNVAVKQIVVGVCTARVYYLPQLERGEILLCARIYNILYNEGSEAKVRNY